MYIGNGGTKLAGCDGRDDGGSGHGSNLSGSSCTWHRTWRPRRKKAVCGYREPAAEHPERALHLQGRRPEAASRCSRGDLQVRLPTQLDRHHLLLLHLQRRRHQTVSVVPGLQGTWDRFIGDMAMSPVHLAGESTGLLPRAGRQALSLHLPLDPEPLDPFSGTIPRSSGVTTYHENCSDHAYNCFGDDLQCAELFSSYIKPIMKQSWIRSLSYAQS